MEGPFDIHKSSRLSGLPITMLDYLCRTKIVSPSSPAVRGRGRKRLYTFSDIIILRYVSKLLSSGVGVSRLGKALHGLRTFHPEFSSASLPSSYIVTDGRDVFLQRGDQVLESLATGQFAFAFVIEVARLRTEVIHELERMRSAS